MATFSDVIRVTRKGNIDLKKLPRLADPNNMMGLLSKLAEGWSVGYAKQLKENIINQKTSTGSMEPLKASTKAIRRRRIKTPETKKGVSTLGNWGEKPKNITKPLQETGHLLESIKPSKGKFKGEKGRGGSSGGVRMYSYGFHQASGFTVASGYMGGIFDGTDVPSRDFITTPGRNLLLSLGKITEEEWWNMIRKELGK
jgi:hypothetical protein